MKQRRLQNVQQQLSRFAPSAVTHRDSSPTADAAPATDTAAAAATAPVGGLSAPPAGQRTKESLLTLAAKARKGQPEETEQEKALKEEADLLRQTTQHKALQGVQELAKVSTAGV